jgi:Na+-transporting methylmalonyl-CoA/oxaloacetate decarboxylase gamma subunit
LRTKKTRGPKEPKSKKKGTGTAVRGSSYAQQVAHDVVPRFDPVHEVHRDAELRCVALHFLFFFCALFFRLSFFFGFLRRVSSFCVVFVLLFFCFGRFVRAFCVSGCFARFEKNKKKKRKKKRKKKKRKKEKKEKVVPVPRILVNSTCTREMRFW